MQALLLLHFLGDFLFQNEETVSLKKQNPLYGTLVHLRITALVYFVGLLFWMILVRENINNNTIFTMIGLFIILLISHFIIDLGKIFVSNHLNTKMIRSRYTKDFYSLKNTKLLDILVFFLDQAIHIGIILILVNTFDDLFMLVGFSNMWIILANALVISVFVGHVVIQLILDYITMEIYTVDEQMNNAINQHPNGKFIGIYERLLFTPVVIAGFYNIFFVIIALKVVTGFKSKAIEDRDTFIVGNILSILMAFVGVVYFWVALLGFESIDINILL